MDSEKIINGISKFSEANAKRVEKRRTDTIASKAFETTTRNNNECNRFCNTYNETIEKNANVVGEYLKKDPSYTGKRSVAVREAWKIEKEEISYGGNGITRKFNKEQKEEIINKGSVSGMQGHHEQNVADNLREQANPNNIVFCTRKEHKEKHNGSWSNPTNGKMLDKEKKLRQTNTKRNIKNEISGAGMACGSSAVSGFMNGCINNAGEGSAKETIKAGAKSAAKAAGKTLVDYTITRILKK